MARPFPYERSKDGETYAEREFSRVFKLFEGLREERIAKAMSIYGMDKDDLEEGRRLIDALTQVKLDAGAIATDESGTFQKLDAWENRWFPIAMATLERRHPAVHA